MKIKSETIIGQLVAEDFRMASVFKSYDIDFCCNGIKSIGSACLEKNISVDAVLQQLQNLPIENVSSMPDYLAWPLDLLADYIEKIHHRFVRTQINEIIPLLHKIIQVHGGHRPELLEVEKLFQDSANELTNHMMKEERILFPYIRQMVSAHQSNNYVTAPFGTVQNPIRLMMNEHDAEGERFKKIAQLTHDYNPPSDACITYRVTYALLNAFEEDLHKHIHLENNILFPKAMEMENTFAAI